MKEEEVRAIVRDEIANWHAAKMAAEDQANALSFERHTAYLAKMRGMSEPSEGDGPTVEAIKAIMRGD